MSESASKLAILAQASQAHLGEICRDANPQSARGHREGRFVVLRVSSPRRGTFILGERESPPSEHELA